jgi:putative ABC transport system ATP-binding protein
VSLEIQSLNKYFHQGDSKIEVLKNLQVKINSSEIVSIIGQSGSGKSTLLSIIAGLEKPNAGKVILNGTDIVPMSEKEITHFRAQHLSLVFQQYHLVAHLTALENVSLPLEILKKTGGQEKAQTLLAELGLNHRLNHFPNQLSGGECQRVAIARALVTEPQILLADEPSGNLDIETGQKVMEVFLNLAKKYKATTIIVTHNEQLARKCQRQFHLRSGELVESSL